MCLCRGMMECLQKLKEGRSVEVPVYDFALHARVEETRRVRGGSG